MEIRDVTISYSSKKKKEAEKMENDLEKDLHELESKMNTNPYEEKLIRLH